MRASKTASTIPIGEAMATLCSPNVSSPADIVRAQAAAAAIPAPLPARSEYPRTASGMKGVTDFIAHTYELVSDPACDAIVRWSDEGTSFIITDTTALEASVLGSHFKHSKFSSFQRQLNMYGFSKIGPASSSCEFFHDGFRRGRVELLRYIKRRVKSSSLKKAAAARSSASPAKAKAAAHDTTAVLRRELSSLKRQRDELSEDVAVLAASQAAMDEQLAEVCDQNARLRAELDAAHAAHASMVQSMDVIMSMISSKTNNSAVFPPFELDPALVRPAKRQRTLHPRPEPVDSRRSSSPSPPSPTASALIPPLSLSSLSSAPAARDTVAVSVPVSPLAPSLMSLSMSPFGAATGSMDLNALFALPPAV